MSPIDTYRGLFGLTGRTYVIVTFLARLPLAMSQLGVLLLVADSTGSYGAGGTSAGALAVANAVASPAWGALADRLGQRRVVAVQSLSAAAAIAVLLVVAHSGLPWGYAAVASAVVGLLAPQIGPLARVRWRPITDEHAQPHHDRERLVDAAFSYEGAADEASFVLGPALVGLGASLANPSVALAGAGVVLAIFGLWFAMHDSARLTHAATAAMDAFTGRLFTPALIALCLAQLSVGSMFGSVQNGTSVLATNAGNAGLTGYFHALLGVGSVVAGLAMAAMPARFALPDRLRVFSLTLLVLSAPLLLVGSLLGLAPVLLVLGFSIAPFMITTFTIAERITPARRTGAAMTLLAAATGLGYAIGAALAGRLADAGGHTPAFAVTVCAAGLAVIVSWSCAGVLRRADVR